MHSVPDQFHPTTPAFIQIPAFLTGNVDRCADGLVIRAEVIIYPGGQENEPGDTHWVPYDALLSHGEPVRFSPPAEG